MPEYLPENQILVYSTVWCTDCKRAKKFFGEQRVSYVNIGFEANSRRLLDTKARNAGLS
jgi:glutaredoxin